MKFFDTPITIEAFGNMAHVLQSGFLSEGELVAELESELYIHFGYRRGVAVNSGTSALHLALVLAGVGRGDEVIIPAQTFVATGLAVLYCGAKPVFSDIQLKTGNINPERIIDRITSRTKAVICVSWGGNPCDLMGIQKLCNEHGLYLIQDNAQAFGATYLGESISGFGHFSCFSFQAIKHLTTGDGGLLTCKTEEHYEKARRLRWFGIDRENDFPDETGERQYNLEEIGYKYHMNNVAAALGLGNLHGVKDRLKRRRDIAKAYDEGIGDMGTTRHIGSSNWLYTILVNRRKDFIRMMKSKDIPVSVVHNGIHKNKIFGRWDLPVQRAWDEHHICLPINSSLTDEDVEQVINAVNGGW